MSVESAASLRVVSQTKRAFERCTGACAFASDSVLVRTEPGFPAVKPADFPGLEAGIYSLDYGEHETPRPDVKRLEKRITRSTALSAETQRLSIVAVLDALVRHVGFNGPHDTTTEICLKQRDIKHKECSRLIGGSMKNKSLSGILGPWLKRYAGVMLVGGRRERKTSVACIGFVRARCTRRSGKGMRTEVNDPHLEGQPTRRGCVLPAQ